METSGLVKRYAVHSGVNAGLLIHEKGGAIVGEDPKAFLAALEDGVAIGGKKLSMMMGPGDVKFMGGMFHLNGFPMSMFPSTMITPQPMLQLDFEEIIGTVVEMGTAVMDMFSLLA